jgi:hypothetical protein
LVGPDEPQLDQMGTQSAADQFLRAQTGVELLGRDLSEMDKDFPDFHAAVSFRQTAFHPASAELSLSCSGVFRRRFVDC